MLSNISKRGGCTSRTPPWIHAAIVEGRNLGHGEGEVPSEGS